MALFQGAFVNAMNDLSEKGFMLEHEGAQRNFKAFCICCAVDSVARAPMQGTKQFNSYQGCNWCLQVGKRVAKSMKYLVQLEEPMERTEEQMILDMEAAVTTNEPVNGVATASPLVNLQQFHIVWGFVPDYMHCVLLGVARQFLEIWLSDPSCKSLTKREALISGRLVGISPPREVKRMPRPAKERKWWKAKEWENWLLYYSVPVLEGILDRSKIEHWACLVEALHIMLGRTLTVAGIARAEELLLDFHVRAQLLYNKRCMTYNMHQLTHLLKSVRQWGPLWAHSAFPFEAGNGGLKDAVKAANGIPHQICRVIQMEGVTEELLELADQPKVVQFCASLDTRSTQKTLQVSGGIRFFGRGVPYALPSSCDEQLLNCVQYARMLNGKVVLTSRKYAEEKTTIQ